VAKVKKHEGDLAWLLKDGGKWECPNNSYNSKDEWSATSNGYKFTLGYLPGVLKLQITGNIKGKNYLLGGLIFWDPILRKGLLFCSRNERECYKRRNHE